MFLIALKKDEANASSFFLSQYLFTLICAQQGHSDKERRISLAPLPVFPYNGTSCDRQIRLFELH